MFSAFSAYIFRNYDRKSDPTRLSNGISAPSLSEANKSRGQDVANGKLNPRESFSKVALRARAFLDEAYIRLNKAADRHTTEKEWREAIKIGKLDRRTLYAIKSNQGGLFSEAEIKAASLPVEDLLKAATAAADPKGKDPAAAFKASIGVLDGASTEEKVSLSWVTARARAQWGYENAMRETHPHRMPANVKTNNPVVDLFVKAWGEYSASKDSLDGVEDTPSWAKAMSLWRVQESRRADPQTIGYL
ncbi:MULTISPECIES: hypothetical protein [unclassified Methylobacterium]|jgi:hypothetical protein|uniref:hypothetical protein n=1 Tax=unclassified Methylobacterium TaxID=2615210 RepID=UPI001352DAD2|nr:hypothetical protein [Methylobacterium sp. 2A]MWV23212.1 hypothetical protein [Methylobacterium sp. 2A]